MVHTRTYLVWLIAWFLYLVSLEQNVVIRLQIKIPNFFVIQFPYYKLMESNAKVMMYYENLGDSGKAV